MPKTATTGRDQESERSDIDTKRVRRKIDSEGAPAVSQSEGVPGRDMPRDERSGGEPAVSPADGVLDPSLNESSRH
jgi:hypothetical protein